MITLMSVIAGILYASAAEYSVHRYLFHGLGKKASSIFAFHLREHHQISRHQAFIDDRVSRNELIGMPIGVLLHTPMLLISPVLFWTVTTYGILFVIVHNMLHRHPHFAKRYFWWHWNHHMRNQNKSWGVVSPITDLLTGTLEEHE